MSASRIGHYTIVSELGRGGMGVVYKAHEESLNRFVAIKLLGEHLSQDPTFVARFVREAQAAAGLSHPNIIQIFYIGEDNGRHYFVMEYVTGKSLLAMVREEGRIGNPRAAQYMLQAANGLGAAHDKGFIHRDIKPANLMVNEQGLLKIADFGLALPQDATTKLTATGMLMGTPGYLSPEQCRGEGVDRRTDIYSLGVTYYELLSGRMPFQADSPLALLHKILQEEPPDITSLSDSVDPEARRIVNRMIAKDREKRYQDCHELAGDLEKLLAAAGVRGTTVGVAGMRPAPKSDESEQPTSLLADSGKAPSVRPAPASAAAAAPSAPLPAVSAPVSLDSRTAPMVAPPPPPAPAPAEIVASAALVPAPQAVPVPVSAPQTRKSRAPLVALALVAVLLVAMGASAFFALRSPFVRQYLPWLSTARTAKQSDTTPPTSGTTASETATQETQGSPVEGGPAAVGSAAGAGAAGAAPSAPDTAAGGPGTGGEVAGSQAASARRRGSRPAGPRLGTASSGGASGVAADSSGISQGEGLRQPAQGLSGVAVAVVGEEPLAGAVSSLLQSELQAAGLQTLDAATLPGSEDLLRTHGEPSVNELIRSLRASRAAVLVLARVQRVGERMLSYMGRQDVAYSSRVTLVGYDLATGQQKGQSRSAMVEYTQLNLEQATDKAVGPLARDFAQQVR
ncbi:MAG: serine/threonine protein kinase [Acidobacteriia bacterium]|nr:serine/threonine protein kinase [Terriglobia bacterium]